MKKILDVLSSPPGDISRRQFLKLTLGALALPPLLAACAKREKQRLVNFFNWSNYIGKKTIPDFEKETGIHVNYEMFSDEDEAFAKLRSGVEGYDLFVADDYQVPKLVALKLIEALPERPVRGLENLAATFRDPPYDRGLRYTVPYLWGTTGIGFNRQHVPAPRSWKALWNEKYKDKVTMLDNVRDGIGCALLMLGLPTDTADPGHLARARDLLVQQRKLLKHYTSNTYVDELASGEAWLSQGWSGDVIQANRENPQIDYSIPDEGSFLYVSSLVLPAGGRHREEALAFIEYSLRPQVAAEISNSTRFATPNAKARSFLEPAILGDKRIFPDPATMKRLRFYGALAPDVEQLWERTWQEVKVA